ncbi:MAG: acyl-CoA dehydrogenase family protein [Deltaproteobacteria bacterium]|nr:acyl-CoA dehydrogenase family protein [Deltaproteobacteria bacterium]
MTFEGWDFCRIDDELSEEERMARDTTRRFVDDRFKPLITEHFRKGTFPMQLVPEIAELGVFGATIKGYDCAGMNNVAYGLVLQELERGDSGLRSFASVQSSLVMYPIWRYGTEAQKQHWLPLMARGKKIGCFGLTEADFGSDPGGMRTRATLDGDHWVLNGSKMWITNGSIADVAVVWAKTGDSQDSIKGFLVEKGTPGFTASNIEGKFSLRASVTSELAFDGCRLKKDAVLPESHGLGAPLSCLNQARYGISWGVIGAAADCYETARAYALERVQFGSPIAGFQLVQEKLVTMLTEISKAQLLCLRLGRLKDQDKLRPPQVSMAKRNNVSWALEIARLAREVLGANGIADEYPVIRHMLNLESVYTYEGTHDIHTLIVGRDITGLDAFHAGA